MKFLGRLFICCLVIFGWAFCHTAEATYDCPSNAISIINYNCQHQTGPHRDLVTFQMAYGSDGGFNRLHWRCGNYGGCEWENTEIVNTCEDGTSSTKSYTFHINAQSGQCEHCDYSCNPYLICSHTESYYVNAWIDYKEFFVWYEDEDTGDSQYPFCEDLFTP